MVPVLEEIRAQNDALRVMTEDVLRRVSALEGRAGERATGDEKGSC